MDWQKRPYAGKQRPELEMLAKQNWDSKTVLESISHELSFRQKKASVELREKILQRLETLAEHASALIHHHPEGVEKSFLEYLGYTVSDNLSVSDRRKILDAIYSQELPPGPNSSKWGAPGSATRRLLIFEILASRCKRSKRNSHPTEKRWREAWKADLKYFTDRHF